MQNVDFLLMHLGKKEKEKEKTPLPCHVGPINEKNEFINVTHWWLDVQTKLGVTKLISLDFWKNTRIPS